MPADRGEQVDELACVCEPHPPILRRVPGEPPDGPPEPERVVVSDQQDKAERVRQVDVSELSRGGERKMRTVEVGSLAAQ